MKELTIEQKAQAYDRALKVLHKYDGANIMFSQSLKEEMFPELKESKDERIRKQLIVLVKSSLAHTDEEINEMIAWLEKQGEQKSADKVEPKFRIEAGKWYICISQYCNCIEGWCYQALCDGRIIDDFRTEYDMHSDAYKYFRLWTIQDAKDGDVLTVDDVIFIYKRTLANHIVSYCKLINGVFEVTSDARTCCEGNTHVHPATKEQRDLLFQKMKEAGYEWDAEKKELKKSESYSLRSIIKDEPSPAIKKVVDSLTAWSEEDKEMSRFIGNAITTDDSSVYLKSKGIEVIDAHVWLDELKDRVQLQPKQEWSEEDSRILYNVKAYIGYAAGQRGVKDELFKEANEWLNSLPIGFICNKNYNEDMVTLLIGELEQIANDNNAPLQYQAEINWLKSLRPQPQWKPSDEQIEALESATENCAYSEYQDCLRELIGQLKKLREE